MENHVGTKMGAILAEHGGASEYAFIECGECGATASEGQSEGVSDESLTERFEARGWTVRPTRCPDHAG